MACEYYSRVIVANFTDAKTLQKALARMSERDRAAMQIDGLNVGSLSPSLMGQLKQNYATEAARAALKAKGFFVAEKRDAKTGKIRLTVQA